MKKILISVLVAIMAFGLVACSSGVSQEEYDKLVEENNALKSQLQSIYETLESMGDFQTEVSPNANSQNRSSAGAFDVEQVASQLEVTEYSWKTDYYYYAAIGVKNNSQFEIDLSVNVNLLDESKKMVGAKSNSETAIPVGGETVFVFINEEPFSSFEYQFSPSECKYYSCVTQNISYQENLTDKKAIISVTNNGEKPIRFAQCTVIFMNGDTPVYYDNKYCIDNDDELKPNKTQSIELNCYEPFDSIKVFFSGRGDK